VPPAAAQIISADSVINSPVNQISATRSLSFPREQRAAHLRAAHANCAARDRLLAVR